MGGYLVTTCQKEGPIEDGRIPCDLRRQCREEGPAVSGKSPCDLYIKKKQTKFA